MVKEIKIEGYKVAPLDYEADYGDLAYYGHERFSWQTNDSGKKAPFGCEWVTGFSGSTHAHLRENYEVILYIKEPETVKVISGYEIAPDDHILVQNIDLLERIDSNFISRYPNKMKVFPPKGYEWVENFAGKTVGNVIKGNKVYSNVYRPILIPTLDPKPAELKDLVKTKNGCSHKNNHKNKGVFVCDKWCRDCGAFYKGSSKKWLYPKNMIGAK